MWRSWKDLYIIQQFWAPQMYWSNSNKYKNAKQAGDEQCQAQTGHSHALSHLKFEWFRAIWWAQALLFWCLPFMMVIIKVYYYMIF
jgi:hypothetical protein